MTEPFWRPRGRDEHTTTIEGHVLVLWRSPEGGEGWHGAVDGSAVMDGHGRRAWGTREAAERGLVDMAKED